MNINLIQITLRSTYKQYAWNNGGTAVNFAPTHPASYVMLAGQWVGTRQRQCCNDSAAMSVLQRQCCNASAARIVLQR